MPTTSRGYVYPASTAHTRLWEHYQALAQSINDDVSGVAQPPMADLRQANAQTLVDSTWTAITFDAEDFDTANGHSILTNPSRWTCPPGRGGYYLLNGAVSFAANPTGERRCRWYLNGADIFGSGANMDAVAGAQSMLVARPTLVQLSPGDFVELYALQASGGNLSTYVGAGYGQSGMSVVRLGS